MKTLLLIFFNSLKFIVLTSFSEIFGSNGGFLVNSSHVVTERTCIIEAKLGAIVGCISAILEDFYPTKHVFFGKLKL